MKPYDLTAAGYKAFLENERLWDGWEANWRSVGCLVLVANVLRDGADAHEQTLTFLIGGLLSRIVFLEEERAQSPLINLGLG